MNAPDGLSPRLSRELKTLRAMVKLYCGKEHGGKELCPECSELLYYAEARLKGCLYREEKPACSKCPIHCYSPKTREKIRTVMRFAGPRMLRAHPILAVRHLLDSHRAAPAKKKG